MSDKDIFKFTQELDCNELHFFSEEEFGLHAIVAIHNTKLGPSLGGCRCYPYPTTYEAVVDVVRLAQGMTFKSAVSGLNLGGGKAVILYDPEKIQDRDKFFKAFGRIVDSLNGKYITAVDVGTTSQDMDSIRTQTRHVTSHNKVSYKEKDPSPITAIGVLRSMQATAKYMLGSDKLDGVRINIQGLGHVGQYLAKLLIEHGAIVKGFDVRADNIASCVKNYGIIPCASLDEIMFEDCDIFAPCAMGAVLSKESIPKLRAKAVVGAANNQLEDEFVHGEVLRGKGITYAPDYLINAGGVMNCYAEVVGLERSEVMKMAENIYNTTIEIINYSREEGIPTYLAANRKAEKRIAELSA